MTKPLKRKPLFSTEKESSIEREAEVYEEDEFITSKSKPLGDNFKLKSEFLERNVLIPDIEKGSSKPLTQVKVYREQGIDIVDPENLKSFIENNKDIKHVIIEKISINESTRVSLLFEPSNLENHEELSRTLLDELEICHEQNQLREPVFSFVEIEEIINKEFFEGENITLKRESKDIGEEEKNEGKAKKSSFKLRLKEPELNNEDKSSLSPLNNKKSPSHNNRDTLKLKLKSDQLKEGEINYEKHTLTRNRKKSNNSFYYKAKDHVELYKVGNSFLKDFKSGLKSFSFSSKGLKEEQEKSVSGVFSFFGYHEDLRIAIITQKLSGSYYTKFVDDRHKKEGTVFDEDLYYHFFIAEGLEVIEFEELRKVERKIKSYNFEDFLEEMIGNFDLVLWDLPDIEVLDSNKELFFPIIRCLDNISFVVGKDRSKMSDIDEMISYFKRYQIPIKGLLFSDLQKVKRES